MSKKIEILGIRFDNISADDAAESIFRASRKRSDIPCTVFTPNALISMSCYENADLLRMINSATFILPDGTGVVSAAKRQRNQILQRVTGIDTAGAVMAKLARVGGSVYLLGGEEGIAEKAAKELVKKHRGLVVLGTSDGYFNNEEALVKEISRLSPDLLLVGMGFPRQERFISSNQGKLSIGAAIGVGGALDVWAGKIRRAPAVFVKLHIEWLWRMLRQPRRLLNLGQLFRYRMLTRRRFCGKNDQ